MTVVQKRLFNPTPTQYLMGFVAYDVKGEGAVQKIAKRKLDIVSGGVSSHSRCLNDPSRLAAIKERLQMVASAAEISADFENEKKRKADDAALAAAEKEAKKKREAEEEAAKTLELQPKLEELMEPFHAGDKTPAEFQEFTVPVLKELIRYYYQQRPVGLGTMSKTVLVDTLTKYYEDPPG